MHLGMYNEKPDSHPAWFEPRPSGLPGLRPNHSRSKLLPMSKWSSSCAINPIQLRKAIEKKTHPQKKTWRPLLMCALTGIRPRNLRNQLNPLHPLPTTHCLAEVPSETPCQYGPRRRLYTHSFRAPPFLHTSSSLHTRASSHPSSRTFPFASSFASRGTRRSNEPFSFLLIFLFSRSFLALRLGGAGRRHDA